MHLKQLVTGRRSRNYAESDLLSSSARNRNYKLSSSLANVLNMERSVFIAPSDQSFPAL